jgi:uncharacterized BrkB/YihY/UPF0761 family membrane protein
MVRMDLMPVPLGLLLFFILGAVCPLHASLEKISGRPIPRLQKSSTIQRQRIFLIIPICMGLFFVLAISFAYSLTIEHYAEKHTLASRIHAFLTVSIYSLGSTAAFGSLLFWMLWLVLLPVKVIRKLSS